MVTSFKLELKRPTCGLATEADSTSSSFQRKNRSLSCIENLNESPDSKRARIVSRQSIGGHDFTSMSFPNTLPRMGQNSEVKIVVSQPYSASSLSDLSEISNQIVYEACEPRTYLESFVSYRPTERDIDNMFHETDPDESRLASYTQDVIGAVQRQDLNALKSLHESGKYLDGCNRFGESILHMACRRGFTDIVDYMLNVAGISVKIRDDYGRTPLHDACWAIEPNFEMIDLLSFENPELLLIPDKRNHTPLDYARRVHWHKWNDYLKKNKKRLIEKFAEKN